VAGRLCHRVRQGSDVLPLRTCAGEWRRDQREQAQRTRQQSDHDAADARRPGERDHHCGTPVFRYGDCSKAWSMPFVAMAMFVVASASTPLTAPVPTSETPWPLGCGRASIMPMMTDPVV